MTSPASDSLKEITDHLDARIQRVDEERWLSSRYANSAGRDALIVLYAFYYELARVRLAVTDPTLGQIRFQWWRDALAGIEAGEVREHDLVLALADQVQHGRLNNHALTELIDLHETAFLESDRDLEPESDLAILAAEVVAPQHEVTDLIRSIAPDWARLRRGEEAQQSFVGARVSSALRPALGHYRLRWSWRKGHQPSPSGRRLSILLAIMTGKI